PPALSTFPYTTLFRSLHACWRIHLVGRVALDIDDREPAIRVLGLAIDGLHDRLVSNAVGELDRAPGSLVGHVLERCADLLVRRRSEEHTSELQSRGHL